MIRNYKFKTYFYVIFVKHPVKKQGVFSLNISYNFYGFGRVNEEKILLQKRIHKRSASC